MAPRQLLLVRKLFGSLHHLWRNLRTLLLQDETRWRHVPTGSVTVLLTDLKPATQKIYLDILQEFNAFAGERGLVLQTRGDVGVAAHHFVCCNAKSRGFNLISALHRCYPPLKGHLTWTAARLKVLAAANPPVHHLPMDWLVAVAMCVSSGPWTSSPTWCVIAPSMALWVEAERSLNPSRQGSV